MVLHIIHVGRYAIHVGHTCMSYMCACMGCISYVCFMLSGSRSDPRSRTCGLGPTVSGSRSRTRGPPWLLLRGGGAMLHPTSTRESSCGWWVPSQGDGDCSPDRCRTQAHDSFFGDRIAHADVRPRTRNQGISVCNLLGNCNGTGAAPRTIEGHKHTILCLWSRTRIPW